MGHIACLVCFIGTVNGRNKKKKEKKAITSGTSSRHTRKLKQSILLRCLWSKLKQKMCSVQLLLSKIRNKF